MLCSGLSQASLPYLIGRLVDVLSGKDIGVSILFCCCILFTAFFLNTLFNMIKSYCFFGVCRKNDCGDYSVAVFKDYTLSYIFF